MWSTSVIDCQIITFCVFEDDMGHKANMKKVRVYPLGSTNLLNKFLDSLFGIS